MAATFREDISITFLPNTTGRVAWQDYNLDSQPDFLFNGWIRDNYSLETAISQLYQHTGAGFIADTSVQLPKVSGLTQWFDYNNDSKPDFFLSGWADSAGYPDVIEPFIEVNKLYQNTGNTFVEDTSVALTMPGFRHGGVQWLDFNHDEKMDYVLTGYDGYVTSRKLYKNTGNSFTEYGTLPNGNYTYLDWVDYNQDSKIDFLSVTSMGDYNSPTTNISLYEDTGTGWQPKTSVTVTSPVYSGVLKWLDYNNDSQPDFFLRNSENYATSHRFYKNTGNTFIEDGDLTLYSNSYFPNDIVSWADYDNDGQLDFLVTGVQDYQKVSQLYEKTENGFVANNSVVLPGVAAGLSKFVDYNHDSKPDLLLSGWGNNDSVIVEVHRNTGNGFIRETSLEMPAGIDMTVAELIDYNDDHRPDLVMTGGDRTTKLYRNTGENFTPESSVKLRLDAQLDWQDINGDDKLDLLVTDSNSTNTISRIYMNTGEIDNDTNPPPDPITGENVMRFWDKKTNAHFFTANQTEIRDRLNNPERYDYEGNEFDTPVANTAGALPVYRYQNQTTQTYFYSFQEPDLISGNYPVLVSDGIAFHAFPESAQTDETVAIHRFYNREAARTTGTPVHFFTGTEENKQVVINYFPSFQYEGAGWFAYPNEYV